MFLKSLLAFILTVCVATVAVADNSITIGVDSDNIYRGESLTDDTVSANLGLRFGDLFLSGLYLRGDLTTLELTPLDDTIRFRSDLGVGYVFDLNNVSIDASFNRVFNPLLRESDYNEARVSLETDWDVAGFIDFYGDVAYIVNDSNDWYVGTGLALNEFMTDRLNLRVGANWYYFDNQGDRFSLDNFSRNNWEVSGDYRVWRNVSLTGLYSFGRVGSTGALIDDEWRVGLQATF
jgi:hypothetical protein